jgi:hypothetical protein
VNIGFELGKEELHRRTWFRRIMPILVGFSLNDKWFVQNSNNKVALFISICQYGRMNLLKI